MESQIVLVRPQSPRPRQIGSLPQILSPSTSPTMSTLELGAGGAALFALAGALIGHFSKKTGHGAAIGAGVGVVVGGVLGYYEGMHPVLNVAPGGNYNVTLTGSQALTINASGSSNLNATNSMQGAATSSATYLLAGVSNSLSSGSNVLNVSWTDSSGNSQQATVSITAP